MPGFYDDNLILCVMFLPILDYVEEKKKIFDILDGNKFFDIRLVFAMV